MARPPKPHYHDGAGRWFAAIGPPGKNGRATEQYAPHSVRSERAAWKWMEEELARRRARRDLGPVVPVSALCNLYLDWARERVAAEKMTAGHLAGLVSKLTLFTETSPTADGIPMGERYARDVTPPDLQACVERWQAEGYAPHYRKGLVRAVRSAFRWGADHIAGREPAKLLETDPLHGYRGETLPEAPDRYVDPAVVETFLRWAWGQARGQEGLTRRFDRLFLLWFRFLMHSGCRPGEACRLTWSMIDWEARTIVMRGKATGKTGKQRRIMVTAPLARILRVIERLPDHHPEFVFTHMRGRGAEGRGHTKPEWGEPWPDGSAASAKVRALRLEAIEAKAVPGLVNAGPKKLIAYTNRHVYASDALMSGMTASEAAELLGNTAPLIESTYGHIQAHHTLSLADQMAERKAARTKAKPKPKAEPRGEPKPDPEQPSDQTPEGV